jgi:hypothetical protein
MEFPTSETFAFCGDELTLSPLVEQAVKQQAINTNLIF